MAMQAGTGAVNSDINITPLVDVVLVLLIIFMVVTPMLQKGQAVQLPLAGNPDKKPDDQSQIMVVVTAKPGPTGYVTDQIWIDKEKFEPRRFEDAIKEAFDRNPSGDVMVKADSRLPYGDVKFAILAIRDANFKNVGLIAQKKDS
jgi:biopolymer transport protein ExbD